MNEDSNIISLSSLFDSDNNSDFEKDFEMIEIEDEPPKENEDNLVSLNELLSESEVKEEPKEKKNHDKLIERIQIGLIIFLIISASLVYFFGYDLLEPYIKID